MLDNLLIFLGWLSGGTITLATVVLVSFGVFKFLARKWLEDKFQKGLEDYRHARAKEIERLKYEVNALLDRATKFHQQEFDVLPELWRLLCLAISEARNVLAPLQLATDITSLSDDQLDSFLKRSPLDDVEQARVKGATKYERSPLFQDLERGHRLRSAWQKWTEFNDYLIVKGIFVEPELRGKCRRLSALIADAFDEYREAVSETGRPISPERHDTWKALREEGDNLRQEIEEAVSSRLWSKTDQTALLP